MLSYLSIRKTNKASIFPFPKKPSIKLLIWFIQTFWLLQFQVTVAYDIMSCFLIILLSSYGFIPFAKRVMCFQNFSILWLMSNSAEFYSAFHVLLHHNKMENKKGWFEPSIIRFDSSRFKLNFHQSNSPLSKIKLPTHFFSTKSLRMTI